MYVGGCVFDLRGISQEITCWPSSWRRQLARRSCVRAINPVGLRCDRVIHEAGFGLWFGSMFV